MFEWLRRKSAVAPDRLSNRRVLVRPARIVRGRYDAAQTTSDNERHWANADFLAADAAPLAPGPNRPPSWPRMPMPRPRPPWGKPDAAGAKAVAADAKAAKGRFALNKARP